MATIVTRAGKGSPLTNQELDSNFSNLNTDKAELSGSTFTGNLSLGDNVKLQLGNQTDGDLQVYHDGTNSFVTDEGTGDLILRGANVRLSEQSGNENFVYCSAHGAVTLYYDNSPTLATASSGISVTGSVVADGLTVEGASVGGTYITSASGSAAGDIKIQHIINSSRSINTLNSETGSGSAIRLDLATGDVARQTIASNGDISFYEDTGSTPKFIWSAASESLGIGRSPLSLSSYTVLDLGAKTVGSMTRLFGASGMSHQIMNNNTDMIISADDNDQKANTKMRLRTDGADRVVIDDTGIDVTGTVTADGLTVDSGTYHKVVSTFPATYTTNLQIGQQGNINNNALTDTLLINHNAQATQSNVLFKINNKSVLKLQEGGDISFYDSSGTSQNFFWDSSASSLGIGTTVPARPLTVNGLAGFRNSTTGFGTNDGFDIGVGGSDAYIVQRENANIIIETNGAERLRIKGDGSSVFSGSVGIGNTSPDSVLTAVNAASTAALRIGLNNTSYNYMDADNNIFRNGAGTERMRIDSSGRVGIGEALPLGTLHVKSADSGASVNGNGNELVIENSGSTGLSILSGITGDGNIFFGDSGGSVQGKLSYSHNGDYLSLLSTGASIFYNGGSERMRIDSSGNLLVGTTSVATAQSPTQTGVSIRGPIGRIEASADGTTSAIFNRETNSGAIVNFASGGTTAGSIGTVGGDVAIYSTGSSHAGLRFAINAYLPTNNAGAVVDATTDFGTGAYRYKDLYLSSGVYLGGTGAANKLDDYEEGTFSPMTSTQADVYHARYTKIGNLVTINCSFKMKTGQSRNNISLPFTPLNDGLGKNTASNDATNNRYSGSVSFFEASTSVTNLMLFQQGNQGAAAYFIAQTGSQQWPEAINNTEYGTVAVSFTYQTS